MTIYFIEMEGSKAIKIGFTANNDVQQRIRQLQTGQPQKLLLIGTVEGDKIAERGMHEAFAELRGGGEWFEGTTALRWLLQVMIEQKLPWTFCRAYALLEPWKEEILSEVTNNEDWKDRQIRSQHSRIKKLKAQVSMLKSQLRPDFSPERYEECWGLLGESAVSAASDAT